MSTAELLTGTIVILLGAESTGKTTLAHALENELRRFGFCCSRVDEYLREFCDINNRTPTQEEQHLIAQIQARRIEMATATSCVVIADTSPLMTAVYSEIVFCDTSLYEYAFSWHFGLLSRSGFLGNFIVLLMGLDLPWVADGIQRDGVHIQPAVDRLLRKRLQEAGILYQVIYGQNEQRTHEAMRVLQQSFNGLW